MEKSFIANDNGSFNLLFAAHDIFKNLQKDDKVTFVTNYSQPGYFKSMPTEKKVKAKIRFENYKDMESAEQPVGEPIEVEVPASELYRGEPGYKDNGLGQDLMVTPPEREGYIFRGWSTKPIDADDFYDITVDEDGRPKRDKDGNIIGKLKVEELTKIEQWDEEKAYAFTADSPINKSYSVYPVWEEEIKGITFVLHSNYGGSQDDTKREIFVPFEQKLPKLSEIKDLETLDLQYGYLSSNEILDKATLPDGYATSEEDTDAIFGYRDGFNLVGWSTSANNRDTLIEDLFSNKAMIAVEGEGKDARYFLSQVRTNATDETQAYAGKVFKEIFPDEDGIVDLYAAWKEFTTVSLDKSWYNAAEGEYADDPLSNILKGIVEGNIDPSPLIAKPVQIGLIYRTAVSESIHPTVNEDILHRIYEGSLQDLNPNGGTLIWNVPSYDEYGKRLSYVAVEFEQGQTGRDRFNSFGETWNNIWISVGNNSETDWFNENISKVQSVVIRNDDDTVDAFSGATVRIFKENGEEVTENDREMSTVGSKPSYDTKLFNIKTSLVNPVIKRMIHGDKIVELEKPSDDRVEVVEFDLPEGGVIAFQKQEDGSWKRVQRGDNNWVDYTGRYKHKFNPGEDTWTLTLDLEGRNSSKYLKKDQEVRVQYFGNDIATRSQVVVEYVTEKLPAPSLENLTQGVLETADGTEYIVIEAALPPSSVGQIQPGATVTLVKADALVGQELANAYKTIEGDNVVGERQGTKFVFKVPVTDVNDLKDMDKVAAYVEQTGYLPSRTKIPLTLDLKAPEITAENLKVYRNEDKNIIEAVTTGEEAELKIEDLPEGLELQNQEGTNFGTKWKLIGKTEVTENEYDVKLTASDEHGNTNEKVWTIKVMDRPTTDSLSDSDVKQLKNEVEKDYSDYNHKIKVSNIKPGAHVTVYLSDPKEDVDAISAASVTSEGGEEEFEIFPDYTRLISEKGGVYITQSLPEEIESDAIGLSMDVDPPKFPTVKPIYAGEDTIEFSTIDDSTQTIHIDVSGDIITLEKTLIPGTWKKMEAGVADYIQLQDQKLTVELDRGKFTPYDREVRVVVMDELLNYNRNLIRVNDYPVPDAPTIHATNENGPTIIIGESAYEGETIRLYTLEKKYVDLEDETVEEFNRVYIGNAIVTNGKYRFIKFPQLPAGIEIGATVVVNGKESDIVSTIIAEESDIISFDPNDSDRPDNPDPERYVEITLDANGGEYSEGAKSAFFVKKDYAVKASDFKDARLHLKAPLDMAFIHWTTDKDGKNVLSDQGETFDENATIYAQYRKDDNIIPYDPANPKDPNFNPPSDEYITLTLNANGGEFAEGTKSAFHVKKAYTVKATDFLAAERGLLVPENKDFVGWYLDAEGSELFPTSGMKFTENSTLYAQYGENRKIIPVEDLEKDPLKGYVRVTFDATDQGTVNNKEQIAIDVIEGMDYSNRDLQRMIAEIEVISKNDKQEFISWDSEIPTNGEVLEATYTAQFASNQVGVIFEEDQVPRSSETSVIGNISPKDEISVENALVIVKDKNDLVIGRTLANKDGSFKVGTRPLIAGEEIKVEVKLAGMERFSEPTIVTVATNLDRLNALIPIASDQYENFKDKTDAFNKVKVEALKTALDEANEIVKSTDATQEQIDKAAENLESALKGLTANIPPIISGPKTYEIYVGEKLSITGLKDLVAVSDADGMTDLEIVDEDQDSGNPFVAVKITQEDAEVSLEEVLKTAGDYKVTYTVKDKAGAVVTHEMTLAVRERTTAAIEIEAEPDKMTYPIAEKDETSPLDLTGMKVNLVDNLGEKTEISLDDENLTLKVNGEEVSSGSKLSVEDDLSFIQVEYNLGEKTLTTRTENFLRVFYDLDGDGMPDSDVAFDINKVDKLEILKQPQLDYIGKTSEDKFTLNLEGMIVRMSDRAGRIKLAVVDTEGKFVDYDTNDEITNLSAEKAHGAALTPQTDEDHVGDNGSSVTIKLQIVENDQVVAKTAETHPLNVFYDANGDGEPDYDTVKTATPTVTARNIKDNAYTTVEGYGVPGATLTIMNGARQILATVEASDDGKYTVNLETKLEEDAEVLVTAKLSIFKESDEVATKVFNDADGDGRPDTDQAFDNPKVNSIEFAKEPNLTFVVENKDDEVKFTGKDANDDPILIKLSYTMGDKTIENIVTLEKLMTDDNFNVTPANGTSDKLTAKDHNLTGHTIRIEKTEDAGVFAQTENKFNIVFKSDTSEVPVPGFNKVVFSPGTDGQFKDPAATHVLYVRPDTIVNLADTAPEITANAGKAFIGWDTNLVGKFEDETTITAKYSDSVSDNYIDGWTKISFNSGENGRFAADAKTSLWVNPKEALTLADAAPEIIPNANYSFKAWTADGEEVDLDQAKIYNEATTFTATYESDVSDEVKEGFVKVSFNPGEHGKFAANAVTELYVRADKKVDLSTKAPKITPYTGYSHFGWTPKLEGEFSEDTTITAQYEKGIFDSEAIEELIVQGPNKVTYAEGERLDLEGLRAIAIDNKGMKKTYAFAGGAFKDSDNNQLQAAIKLGGNAVNLDDLPELTNAEHDGKNIIVVYNNVEYESSIKLSVSKLQSKVPTNLKAANRRDDTIVIGKAVPGADIKVYNAEGTEIGAAKADASTGEFTATVSKQELGAEIQVTATETGKSESQKAGTTVFLDEDGNWIDDSVEQTPTPTVTARNVGENPIGTTVEVKTAPGAKITINYNDKQETGSADTDGNCIVTVEPMLEVGTEITVTAKDGDKKESLEYKTLVFADQNDDGIDDSSEEFDISKAVKLEIIYEPAKMSYLVTSDTDTAKFETKGMVVKVTDSLGKEKYFTAEEMAADPRFTITPDTGDTIGITDNDKTVSISLEGKIAETTGTLSVKLDENNNGIPDDQENIDIADITEVEILANPIKMDYLVRSVKDTVPFETKGLVTRLTDSSGRKATYTSDELPNDIIVNPANGEKIGLTGTGESNTLTLTVTAKKAQPALISLFRAGTVTATADDNITVKLDANGNGIADEDEVNIIPVEDETADPREGLVRVTLTSDNSVKFEAGSTTIYDVKTDGSVRYADVYNKVNVTAADGYKNVKWYVNDSVVTAEQKVEGDRPITLTAKAEGNNAIIYTPSTKTLDVVQSTTPSAKDFIANMSELPKATEFSFVTELDTSTIKESVEVSIKVDYPDGSSETVTTTMNVVAREKLEAPTIITPKQGDTVIKGNAREAKAVDITIKKANGDTKAVYADRAVNSDGSFEVLVDPLEAGDRITVVAKTDGKDSAEALEIVKVEIGDITETIQEIEEFIEQEKAKDNWNPQNPANAYDRDLQDKLDSMREILERVEDDNLDNDPSQTEFDQAEADLKDAFNRKNSDGKVTELEDKIKAGLADQITDNDIQDAQNAIDKIQGSTDPDAADFDEAKKELQDRLDLVEAIKKAEEALKDPENAEKPDNQRQPVIDALEEAKQALVDEKIDEYQEMVEKLEDSVRELEQEKIVVGVGVLYEGLITLNIETSVPYATVVVKIDGIEEGTIRTNRNGQFSLRLSEELIADQEIELIATKEGFNEGYYSETVY